MNTERASANKKAHAKKPLDRFAYYVIHSLNDIWIDFGKPCPHLVRFVRHRMLKKWPAHTSVKLRPSTPNLVSILCPPENIRNVQNILALNQVYLQNKEAEQQQRRASSSPNYHPLISIVVCIDTFDEILLHKCLNSVLEQTYERWEFIIIINQPQHLVGIRSIIETYKEQAPQKIQYKALEDQKSLSEAYNLGCTLASGEYIGFIGSIDFLELHALEMMVSAMQDGFAPDLLYTDHAYYNNYSALFDPVFKPDWSPELLLSFNYIQSFFIVNRILLSKIKSFDTSLQTTACLYDILLKVAEQTKSIIHIHYILYRQWAERYQQKSVLPDVRLIKEKQEVLEQALKRREIPHKIRYPRRAQESHAPFYKIDYVLESEPKVTIIIPTKNRKDLLRKCLNGVKKYTQYNNFEILVIDNGSDDPATVRYLQSIPENVERIPTQHFNYSAINNQAVRSIDTDFLLFMNDDVEPINPLWLKEMIGVFSLDEHIGVVGAKLLYPKNKNQKEVQHSGIVLGRHYASLIQFRQANELGYNFYNQVLRNCAAVTGACLLTKKSLFDRVGGFDEINLAVDYSDVDYCLKILKEGFRVVITPHALLTHHESATRGDNGGLGATLNQAEADFFAQKWKNLIKNDPYYNPHLTLNIQEDVFTL